MSASFEVMRTPASYVGSPMPTPNRSPAAPQQEEQAQAAERQQAARAAADPERTGRGRVLDISV
jgi:hypothetical protein